MIKITVPRLIVKKRSQRRRNLPNLVCKGWQLWKGSTMGFSVLQGLLFVKVQDWHLGRRYVFEKGVQND
jgi:hypothetical protein